MKKGLVIYLLTALVLLASAQEGDYFLSIKRYPFINYSKNEITFLSDSTYFNPIYNKIDSIVLFGKGKLNIVHIGGSHIQADIYTHQIRKQLQSIQYDMNGGRGFIFPYTLAQTNNPWNYQVSYTGNWDFCKNTKYKPACQLGLAGYSVSTSDTLASISINLNNDSLTNFSYNHVKVFHTPGRYNLSIVNADSAFSGVYDSIGGYTAFNVLPANTLELVVNKSDSTDTKFTLFGFNFENDNPGIVYHAIGVNGAKLESYLNCALYKQQIAQLNPDLVIFSIGTNDGNTKHFNTPKYYREYRQLINTTRQACPNTRIMITVPNDAYYYKRYVNKNTLQIRKEIFKIVQEENYAVWDFFSIMGGLNSSQEWYRYGIMKYDRVHFTRPGYLLKGDLFVTAFLRGWEKNITLRSKTYFEAKKLTQNITTSQSITNDRRP